MKKALLLVGVLCLSLLVEVAWAQQRTVTGKVTSEESGEPLPGVNVVLRGTNVGSITDLNGYYNVVVQSDAGILVFSFIGLETQEVQVGTRSAVNVVMKADVKQLGEVVVTAQGIERQEKSLGYAATAVSGDQLSKTSQVDPMKSLQGRIPGVTITSGGGAPGASTKVIIRGYSSVTGANNPLYVIDGTPINNETRTSVLSGLDFGNRSIDINPNDVESMTILSGAAATNMYGPRGANGVIVITTKSGKSKEGLKVDFNSSVTVSDVLRLPQMQNTFGQGWSGHWADDENGSWGPEMDGKIRAWGNVLNNSQKIKPFSPVDDNLYEFYDYGQQYFNSISLSGGSEKSTFYLSYSNNVVDGVIPTNVDKDNRNTFTIKGKTYANKISATTTLSYVRRDGSMVPDGYGGTNSAANLFSELLQIPRDFSIVDLKDYNDEFNNLDNFYTPYAFNPYYSLNENQSSFYENRIFGNLTLNYDILDWISAKWMIGTDFSSFKRNEWEAIMRFRPGSYQYTKKVTENPGMYLENVRDTRSLESDFIVSIDRNITQDLSLNAYIGYNARMYEYESLLGEVKSLVIPYFYNFSNSSDEKGASTYVEKIRQLGTYSNITLGYRDYLFLDLGGRYDQSSTLPKESNSFFYPKASMAWMANETFPQLGNIFDILKFRVSWGKAGNDAPPYALFPVMTPGDIKHPFYTHEFPLGGVKAYEVGDVIGNPNLKPEITTETEFGIKVGAFDNRLGFDISLYDRVSDGQILKASIAPSSGYLKQYTNFGKVSNKGFEILASVVPVKAQDFSWTVIGTYSKNDNLVTDLPEGQEEIILRSVYGVDFVAIEGMPLGQLRAPDYQRDAQGSIIVNDKTGIPTATTEKTIIGDIHSKYVAGAINEISYKNFDFSFTLDYRPGGYMYSGTADLHYFVGNATQTTFNERQPFLIPNSVKKNPDFDPEKVNENPEIPEYIENDVAIDMNNINAYYYHSANAVMNRDRIIPRGYLKLRDVNLAYSLPSNLLRSIPVEGASLVFSGRNLLLFTPDGNNFIDPESTSFGNDLGGEMGEFRTGPTYRSFTLSLKVSL